MMLRALDMLVRPQVSEFVHLNALRMGRTQLLTGAAAAARVFIGSYEQALVTGNAAPLTQLRSNGCLECRLHDHLVAELLRGQQCGAVEEMAAVLTQQRRHIEDATPVLESTTLIVGCHRDGFDGVDRQRLAIGSHLEIVGQPLTGGAGLWRQGVQQRLLRQHGCSVQCVVVFDAGADGPEILPQRYTFEASVPGDSLIDESSASEPEEVEILLVDMNRMLDGNRFWATAEEVTLFG